MLADLSSTADEVIDGAVRAGFGRDGVGPRECVRVMESLSTPQVSDEGTTPDPCWGDGTPITPAQRRLAVRVFSGKLNPALRGQGGRAVLASVDQATLHALMSFVATPRDVAGRLVTTREGEMLLNHRR